MFDEIVVAVDISELGQLERSLGVARKNLSPNGRMILLHIVEPLSGHLASQIDPEIRTNALQAAQMTLKEIAIANGLNGQVDVVVDSGSVYRKIIEYAGDGKHQAIVIASHTPKLGDIVLGSVAAQVVKHAKCSVLVVRSAA